MELILKIPYKARTIFKSQNNLSFHKSGINLGQYPTHFTSLKDFTFTILTNAVIILLYKKILPFYNAI